MRSRSGVSPLLINGSHGEGGGALLRTVLAMAALTQQPVRIHSIRGALRKPGLNSEDLTFLRALQASAGAEVLGDELGSVDLTFVPAHAPKGLKTALDVHSHEKGPVSGNALVILSSLMPVLARSGMYSILEVQGETYGPNMLTYEAFERVSLAAHRKQGLYAHPAQLSAGFGYGSKGLVNLEIEPSQPQNLLWDKRGKLKSCYAAITTAGLDAKVTERGVAKAHQLFEQKAVPLESETIEVSSREPGAFVTLWAEFERGMGCGTAMGQRGLRMEKVVEVAFESFWTWYSSEATVDPFLADQLLIPAALAQGETFFKTSCITRRLITVAWVIKEFLPIPITILGAEGEPGSVSVMPA